MRLPAPIEGFLRAMQEGDYAGLSAALSEGAIVTENGIAYRGDFIRVWLDISVSLGAHALRPIHKLAGKTQLVLTTLAGREDPQGKEIRKTWTFTLMGDLIGTVTIAPAPMPPLPPIVAAYVRATNRSDLDGLMATFHPEAIVNDQLCEYRGRDAIRQWAVHDVTGERLSMCMIEAEARNGNVVVTAHVDGDFDKRGLPDPLVLAYYFSVRDDQIVQLIILRNLPGD